jgi:hypothetical protein
MVAIRPQALRIRAVAGLARIRTASFSATIWSNWPWKTLIAPERPLLLTPSAVNDDLVEFVRPKSLFLPHRA